MDWMPRTALTMKEITELTQYIKGEYTKPSNLSSLQWHRFQRKAKDFLVHNNTLYYKNSKQNMKLLEVIGNDDSAKLERIAQTTHTENDHMKVENLYQKLRCHYTGFRRQTIRAINLDCPTCKPLPAPQKVIPIHYVECQTPRIYLQIGCIDMHQYVEENDKHAWILVVFDVCSKFLIAEPMIRKTGKAVAKKLNHIFALTTRPWIIQYDNSEGVVNDEVIDLMERLRIEYRPSQSHLRNMSQVKQAAQNLTQSLFKHAPRDNPTRWIDVLDSALDDHNRRWHRAINNVPVDVCYGWSITGPRPLLPKECQAAYDQEVNWMLRCELERDSLVGPELDWSCPIECLDPATARPKTTPVEQQIDAKQRQKHSSMMGQHSTNSLG
ncbi:hypothetical protein NEHOM01_1652 [Nematocida homosporus]|uniref:uncharacterized protein n=1 Tax=Nematocida homosporus TaxID=1912981 RepID=UPI00221E68A7|nr:uncharacterized protein NEHOM01_1652 [Nematocida homosporus]KAI5186713.1 hypothetical protein NEHOM01_1652 [Nematocida homosporus]